MNKCSICEGEIEEKYDKNGVMYWDKGNNAQPVNDGRCCDGYNLSVVIPARMGLI